MIREKQEINTYLDPEDYFRKKQVTLSHESRSFEEGGSV